MNKPKSLSKRRELRFWGWGYNDEQLTTEEQLMINDIAAGFIPTGVNQTTPPQVDEVQLRPSRLQIPDSLTSLISTTPYDRLTHSYGKSWADMARMLLRQAPNAPDGVAFPESEQHISDIFDYAATNNLAVIPFGGGTSVCGGVEADVGDSYAGTLTVDMENFNQLIEVDQLSRRARIQAGILGPDMEAALKPHGLTLRHYPQSFPFVTLGGMIATRAGGHFASLYTHIDDLVASTRMVTPQGVIETRALPGSGAGPSADRMIIGSEGTLGIITEATMRLQQRPKWRASASISFANFMHGVEAVRLISQSGLYPTNCRLLDPAEVMINRIANKPCAILVLGFESAQHPVNHWIEAAVDLAQQHGGELNQSGIIYNADHGDTNANAAESWRNAFIRMPYWRNQLTGTGIIADTFETAISWDKFPLFYHTINEQMSKLIGDLTGHRSSFSCRFTHIYPDGPAPYFTFYAVGDPNGNLLNAIDLWRQIKWHSMELIAELGGTVTHHHAVGRDHRHGYQQQSSALFRSTLAAAKAHLDPTAMLNPGALLDPVDRPQGINGIFKNYHS